ncbi:50S ribosomal protein L19e [Candidatus Micrarchaeota archaeon]|nr:50S ribosomal protein L19e [Candidatus Micrarchaeota archaeon]
MIEMSLKTIKRVAADILKCGTTRIRILDAKKASEALTREDVKGLINEGVIKKVPAKGIGRGKAKMKQERKLHGRRSGPGSKKGSRFALLSRKERWTRKSRAQRRLLKSMKNRLAKGAHKKVYLMIKGNAFRDKKHLKDYLVEKGLVKK